MVYKIWMALLCIALFTTPVFGSWEHTIEYIELDFKSQGDGFSIYVSIYDDNDTTFVEEGTVTLEYLVKKDTTPVKTVTYQVKDTEFGDYTIYFTGEEFVAWKTERIPSSSIPSSARYVKVTFTDKNGNKFSDTESLLGRL
jgi:hypothetical protein